MAEVKPAETQQKTRRKVTGSRYIVTKDGNNLNLLSGDGQKNCIYIYTDKDGNYKTNPFEIQNGKPIHQKEWSWALEKWENTTQVAMTPEYEQKVKKAVKDREQFLQLPVAERFKHLPVKA